MGVRVVCGRCRRKLADLRWYSDPDYWFNRSTERGTGRRWRCDRCGADWQVSARPLRTAYEAAGDGGTIVLPLPPSN